MPFYSSTPFMHIGSGLRRKEMDSRRLGGYDGV